jgi:RNA polymerase sigma-54 factor
MTPKMQQSIHLLQLSTLELTSLLQKELVENPLLEEDPSMEVPMEEPKSMEAEAASAAPAAESETDSSTESADIELGRIEFDNNWEDYFADSSDMGDSLPPRGFTETDLETPEMPLAQSKTLKEQLLWQLDISVDGDPNRSSAL